MYCYNNNNNSVGPDPELYFLSGLICQSGLQSPEAPYHRLPGSHNCFGTTSCSSSLLWWSYPRLTAKTTKPLRPKPAPSVTHVSERTCFLFNLPLLSDYSHSVPVRVCVCVCVCVRMCVRVCVCVSGFLAGLMLHRPPPIHTHTHTHTHTHFGPRGLCCLGHITSSSHCLRAEFGRKQHSMYFLFAWQTAVINTNHSALMRWASNRFIVLKPVNVLQYKQLEYLKPKPVLPHFLCQSTN